MKLSRILISFLSIVFLSVSLSSLAEPSLSSLQTNKQGADASKKMMRSASIQTDVHILNNSSDTITVKVPGTTINDLLKPREMENITSEYYFDAIKVVLYDSDGYEFFRDYVPNHATVEVNDRYMARSTDAAKKGSKVQAAIKN